MRAYPQGSIWVVSIAPGEKIPDQLIEWICHRGWPAAAVWGIGAVRDPVLGYYDVARQTYVRYDLAGAWELVACHGTLSTREDTPVLHLHVVLSDREGHTRGGHLFDATISAAGEFVVYPLPNAMRRQWNAQIGLHLL